MTTNVAVIWEPVDYAAHTRSACYVCLLNNGLTLITSEPLSVCGCIPVLSEAYLLHCSVDCYSDATRFVYSVAVYIV